jgi:hypothetical protein
MMKVTMEKEEMFFNGNNVVMNECFPELPSISEYVTF